MHSLKGDANSADFSCHAYLHVSQIPDSWPPKGLSDLCCVGDLLRPGRKLLIALLMVLGSCLQTAHTVRHCCIGMHNLQAVLCYFNFERNSVLHVEHERLCCSVPTWADWKAPVLEFVYCLRAKFSPGHLV